MPPAHTNHTQKTGTASTTRHATNPQTKVHWHTIEFSNNTRTFTHHQAPTQQLQKATLSTLHTPQPQSQNPADCEAYFLMSANDRFPDRHLTSNSLPESVRRGVVGLADSHKVTHTHTPTQIPSTRHIFKRGYAPLTRGYARTRSM